MVAVSIKQGTSRLAAKNRKLPGYDCGKIDRRTSHEPLQTSKTTGHYTSSSTIHCLPQVPYFAFLEPLIPLSVPISLLPDVFTACGKSYRIQPHPIRVPIHTPFGSCSPHDMLPITTLMEWRNTCFISLSIL